jgi:hypothetical protein
MGKLMPSGDYVAIGNTIVEILNSLNDFSRPRKEIEAIFSFKETVDAYEAVFQEYARRG